MAYYDRYSALQLEESVAFFPDVQLQDKATDKFDIYQLGKTRMDKLSDKIYGEPWWGFLIMLANPEHQGLEYLIPNESSIRIPYPLDQTIKELKAKIEEKKKYYGV